MVLNQATFSKSNPLVIYGRSVAHAHLPATQRGFLAAGVVYGSVDYKPTISQAARLFDVSIPYVRAALKTINNGKHAPSAAAESKPIAMTPGKWAAADAKTRQLFIASLGLASVWDTVETLTR